MTTVFFKINDVQQNEVETMMASEGYTSKAEFFRFLIKYYKYSQSAAEKRLEIASQKLADTLRKLDKKGKLNKSLHEQLSNI